MKDSIDNENKIDDKYNKLRRTKYYSYVLGDLPKGCQLCVLGAKEVIYVTGLCPRNCWYCPLSSRRKNRDVVFADEWEISNDKELIQEAKLINALGAGITGGDPLLVIDRTVHYIKLLKERFGKNFHIHLYTSFNLVDEDKLRKLYSAGLDEIRFHPELYNPKEMQLWKRIELAKKFDWDIGIEIPLLVEQEEILKQMIDFFHDKVKFINMNEFEHPKRFDPILGKKSIQLGKRLVNYIIKKGYKLNVHICTAKLKDSIQLRNRLKRRAKRIAKPYHIIDDSLLVYGAIYSKTLNPKQLDYKYKIKFEQEQVMQELRELYYELLNYVEPSLIELDENKKRIVTRVDVVEYFVNDEDLKDKFVFAIIKQYPTVDETEVEIDFLN